MALRPPIHATPSLEQTHTEYEARIDLLGDLASQFLLRAVRHPVPIFWPCCDWYYTGKHSLDNFITSILRYMKLTDDVIFGALMFIQRLRFRTRKPIFKTHPAYRTFISAYILSAKEISRENSDSSSSLEDYDEWAAATQGLFDGDTIQKMEHTTLTILQEDRNKGLQADTTFDGLLPRFCDIIVGDYEVKRQFPFYPQFLTTVRPIFMIHWPEAEDEDEAGI